MSEREDAFWGGITAILILGALKLAWFLMRAIWWLGVSLVLSLGAGIGALAKRGQEPDITGGSGQYSEDHQLWQDEASGQRYPCSPVDREYCQIQASEHGFYWRKTALARLIRRGALVRYKFSAITESSNGAAPEVVAMREFPQEAKRNITLDHVDPARASSDPFDLGVSRDLAKDALEDIKWLLTKKGWMQLQDPEATREHWYAYRYDRPVILWDKPMGEAPPVAGITAA